MSNEQATQFTPLEGHHVSVALRDGSRIDDSQLVAAGHRHAGHVWLFSNGADLFIPLVDVVDLWEVLPFGGTRVA